MRSVSSLALAALILCGCSSSGGPTQNSVVLRSAPPPGARASTTAPAPSLRSVRGLRAPRGMRQSGNTGAGEPFLSYNRATNTYRGSGGPFDLTWGSQDRSIWIGPSQSNRQTVPHSVGRTGRTAGTAGSAVYDPVTGTFTYY